MAGRVGRGGKLTARSRRSVDRLLALVVVLCVATAACTAGAESVSAAGASITMDDDERIELVVPPGVADQPTGVTLSRASEVPPANPGTSPLGPTVEIAAGRPLPEARLFLPVDVAAVQAAGSGDFFVAVYSDSLHAWIPLVTEYEVGQSRAVATTPHFSKYGLFRFDVPGSGVLAGGLTWTGDKIGDLAHDAAGGVKNFAGGILDGLSSWVSGGELKEPECDRRDAKWTVRSTAEEVTGCVVDASGELDLRVGNTYRVPFTLNGPPGTRIGPGESDYELDLIDYIMRVLNGGAGLGSLAQRGTTALGLPDGSYPYGSSVAVDAEPDLLGTALQVIVGLLAGMPGKKELTEQVDRQLVTVLWDARDQSVTVFLERLRQTTTRNLGKSDGAERLETFVDAASCATKSLQGVVNSARTLEARELAKAVVDVAKECTGLALEAADAGIKEVWSFVKGAGDAVVAVRQVVDAIGLGLTHFGGQIRLTAYRGNPDLSLGRAWDTAVEGFGEVRPTNFFLGGASATGGVSNIEWTSWGGPEAEGRGVGLYVGPNDINANARSAPTTIKAWDVGTCSGRQMYRKVTWYYPQYGETFDRDRSFDICSGL